MLPALLFSAQACGQMFSLAPDLAKARPAAGNILHLLSIGPAAGPGDDEDEACSSLTMRRKPADPEKGASSSPPPPLTLLLLPAVPVERAETWSRSSGRAQTVDGDAC